jgi:hypothetical protein
MNKTNVLFSNEYKKLNDICKDSLDMNDGIAEYIKIMESSEGPKKNIDAWVNDYHNLSKCLHIGNILEDEKALVGQPQCTKQDVAWLKKFQKRVEGGEDPIEELKKYHDKLRYIEEKKQFFEPYLEKAAACAIVVLVFLLALADNKNKKKIEEQMKIKKQKKKKDKKKKKDNIEIED